MKTSNYYGVRRIPILIGVLVLSLLFSSCPNTRGEEPPKKLVSAIPISIQFLNADSNSKVEPQEVTIGIYDRDSLVHTPIGNQSSLYTIENGFLSLVIRSNKSPNHEREIPITLPYRFTMKISSNGYLEKTQTVVIDEYQAVYVPVFMMPLDDMPKGSSQAQASGFLDDNAVTKKTIEAITEPSKRSGENGITASLIVEKGTQLYGACKEHEEYENCKEQCKKYPITDPSGEVSIDFYQFDPRFESSANAFPNGFLVTDAVDNQGESLADLQNSFFFSSLGYINLSMKVGQEEVKGFSQPVTLEMEVPNDLTSSVTGSPIKEGYKVPLWSLNETTGRWTEEVDSLALFEKKGKLFAEFKMTHLSTWNLDDVEVQCPLPPITINIINDGAFKARYGEFINSANSMQKFPPGNTNNILLLESNQTHVLRVKRAPNTSNPMQGGELQFKLYKCQSPDGDADIEPDLACADDRTLTLTDDENSECVHFIIKVFCSNSSNCFLPTLTGLWYQYGSTCGVDCIEYDVDHNFAGGLKNGKIDVDMSCIKSQTGPGVNSNYKFKIQFNSACSPEEDECEDDDLCNQIEFPLIYKKDVNPNIWEWGGNNSTINGSVEGPSSSPETSCPNTYTINLTPITLCGPDDDDIGCGFDPNDDRATFPDCNILP